MKRFFLLLAAFTLALCFGAVAAPYPLGTEVAAYNYNPSKLLTDPARPQIYAAVPASNSVIVIDTNTFQVIATIPVGSNPADMAISMDGATLYVANSGSSIYAVSVIDLATLTLVTNYSLPGAAVAIAAGLAGRVYCSVSVNNGLTIYQIDGATGAVQATFNPQIYDNNLFQISPDGKTLFEATIGEEPGTLKSFDVSTATPGASPLQTNSMASENDSQLVISHNGLYLCLPSGGGNPGASGSYETLLFSTGNINADYGSFDNGAYPGPLAFSPDDSLVYQSVYGTNVVLQVFSTQTFVMSAQVNLPSIGEEGYPDDINTIVTDNTGSYLFFGDSSFNGGNTIGQLVVLTTGSGTLTPPSVLPVITSSLDVAPTQGQAFNYQITADYSPTSFGASNLPAGLSVNTTTGLISGAPTVNGYFTAQITAPAVLLPPT